MDPVQRSEMLEAVDGPRFLGSFRFRYTEPPQKFQIRGSFEDRRSSELGSENDSRYSGGPLRKAHGRFNEMSNER